MVLFLSNPSSAEAYRIELYNWRPNGISYDGLPRDFDAAAERRAERFSVTTIRRDQVPDAKPAPTCAACKPLFGMEPSVALGV